MIIRAEDKCYIQQNIPSAVELMSGTSVNGVLDILFDFIMEKGFAAPDYEDYNETGRKVQRIYDHIYEDNVLGVEE